MTPPRSPPRAEEGVARVFGSPTGPSVCRATGAGHLLATLSGRFIGAPVLTLPVDEAFGYTFDPDDTATLGGIGQVFTVAEVRGGWGRLAVSGGVLLRRGEQGVSAVVVPAPADPEARPLRGKGCQLDLDSGWEIVPGKRTGDWRVRPVAAGDRPLP